MEIYTKRSCYWDVLHIKADNVHIEEDIKYIKDYMGFIEIWNDIFEVHNKEKSSVYLCIEIINNLLRKWEIEELKERLKNN